MIVRQYEHLIFFDSNCQLCRSSIQKIIKIDHKKIFCFAPITGKTAHLFFKEDHQKLVNLNTLILVENFSKKTKKYWIRSKGFFRILWLVGGIYKAIGLLYLLPGFLTNLAYKIVAKHRHIFFKKQDNSSFLMKEKDRFLP